MRVIGLGMLPPRSGFSTGGLQIAGPDNRSFVTALGTRVTGNRSRLNESRLIKHAGRIQRIRPTFLQNPPFRYLTSCTCVVTSEQCRAGGE
jgi:hypothetical protein